MLMNKNIKRTRYVAFTATRFALGLTAIACASGNGAGSPEVAGNTGTIDLALTVGPVTLTSISYTIGKVGYVKTGTVDITNSTRIVTTIGGIPAGAGYNVQLSAF